MKTNWPMISALAGLGALYLVWRQQQPLTAVPLGYTPSGAIQGADSPNMTQLRTTDLNSPTYSGYAPGGIGVISTFLGKLTSRTWGVPTGPVHSPSIPNVGIVAGQAPRNTSLIDAARAQDSPSVSPDPDLVSVAALNDDSSGMLDVTDDNGLSLDSFNGGMV